MASANTFTSLMPLFKEAYAGKAMATHKRPGDNVIKRDPFKRIKNKLKKYGSKS